MSRAESLRAEQKKLAKESGPKIGQLSGKLKQAEGDERAAIEAEIAQLKAAPARLKDQIQTLDDEINTITPELESLLLTIPLPPDDDVPVGASSDDNVEIRRWAPQGWDWDKTFEQNRGFKPRGHIELCDALGLVDFPRGVKIAGTRSYVLTGMGMRLHQAILRYAIDFMVDRNGFTPMSVPVLVREEAMVGTGFFPGGRDQAYHVEETSRGGGQDMFLTGTGEVGLMGLHQNEILDEADLPLQYVTVSTCFRREAGAAGKDTAGLYRIHQFDKVEQVVICRADEQESRDWHKKMLGFVEDFLQSLGLPYRLLQCCTGDLGAKNADMIDVECWMPGRGELSPADSLPPVGPVSNRPDPDPSRLKTGSTESSPTGEFGETHSASRLYDYQCRRLNMRTRPGGAGGKGETVFCHSLNNTVAASPRILIPILEMFQNEDGSVSIRSWTTPRFAHLRIPLLVIALVVCAGTFGYMSIEGWGAWDAFYFTLVTITTVGYGDYGISPAGERLAVVLMLTGIGGLAYVAAQIVQTSIELTLNTERKMFDQIERLNDHVIVCGLGRIGRIVCRELARSGVGFVVIELDEDLCEQAKEGGWLVLRGDMTEDDTLTRCGLTRARAIVCAASSDNINIVTTLSARDLCPNVRIISRADSPDTVRKIQRAGASEVISPIWVGAKRISDVLLDEAQEKSETIESGTGSVVVRTIVVTEDSHLAGRQVRDSGVDHPAIAFVRVCPEGGPALEHPICRHRFKIGDTLVIAGDAEAVGAFELAESAQAAA
eukprot:g5659.t1